MKLCRGKILVKPADAAVPYGDSGLVMPITGDSSAIPGEIVLIGEPSESEVGAQKGAVELYAARCLAEKGLTANAEPAAIDAITALPYAVGSKILFNRVTAEKVHLPGEPMHYLIEEKHIQVIL